MAQLRERIQNLWDDHQDVDQRLRADALMQLANPTLELGQRNMMASVLDYHVAGFEGQAVAPTAVYEQAAISAREVLASMNTQPQPEIRRAAETLSEKETEARTEAEAAAEQEEYLAEYGIETRPILGFDPSTVGYDAQQHNNLAVEEPVIERPEAAQGHTIETSAAAGSLAALLGERYAALESQMGAVEPYTLGQASAATNYYRGRVDELNEIKAVLAEQNPELAASLLSLERSEVQFGVTPEEQKHGQGLEVSQ